MGQLIDGVWTTEPPAGATGGHFVRARTAFHGTISADGSSGHKAEAGRYHLYVAHACPWAHRTMIVRTLKRLERAISVSVVDPIMGADGWHFSAEPGAIPMASMAPAICGISISRRAPITPAASRCRCCGTRR